MILLSLGLNHCEEKEKLCCKFIAEKKGMSGNKILDLLLKEEIDNTSKMNKNLNLDCNIQLLLASKTAGNMSARPAKEDM